MEYVGVLAGELEELNKTYRTGKSVVSDEVFDAKLEELRRLDPEHPFLVKVGAAVADASRKEKLPFEMRSLNKVKSVAELKKWAEGLSLPPGTEFVLSAKWDGLALVDNATLGKAWTRGDGVYGQNCSAHSDFLPVFIAKNDRWFTYGEVLIHKQVFLEKYAEDFSNPRNFVAGLLNAPKPRPALEDCTYIRFGVVSEEAQFLFKNQIFSWLNERQAVKHQFYVATLADLTDEMLKQMYEDWGDEFQLDGIVVEVNRLSVQEELGRDRNGNPRYAVAYKGEFEEQKTTKVTGVTWNVSKQGYLKPIINVASVNLDGVNVTNITGNNAKYVAAMQLNTGAVVRVKRSGMVIPQIVDVVEPATPALPEECPGCKGELIWNDTDTELVCQSETCGDKKLQQMVFFFRTIGVERVSGGILRTIYEAGYEDISDVLYMTKAQLRTLPGFGERKADIVYDEIQKVIRNPLPLNVLQHASGFFKGLGSRKLAQLMEFDLDTGKPTYAQVVDKEGFSHTTATAYLTGWPLFWEWLDETPLEYSSTPPTQEALSSELAGQVFCFTGVRSLPMEQKIREMGGEVVDSVTKKTTCLVMKKKGSGSSKEQKAEKMGLKIVTLEELEEEME